MRKLIVLAVFFTSVIVSNTYGQEGFAVKAGLNNVSMKVDTGDDFFGSVSDSELGFYLGGSYNFVASEEFDIEPSVLFSFVDDLTSLYIPIMAKYKINNFNIQAGPQINYLLEDIPDGEFGLDIAFGGGYQIDDNWFVEARYGLQVSRGGDFGDVVDINTLTFGAGYRFN
ncbi:MAG: porin family protein [Flavobacteriaceae bacterium]|uniref:outer membrane beta-barrel protein n=1 Tax=Flagellimonas TaxID=444459 RepID=UPI000E261A70|nr:outer membrane beta-barrel protein [Allomuricauda sp.]MCR9264406.1 porin family protein [Flavobacteriaceae bacterium]